MDVLQAPYLGADVRHDTHFSLPALQLASGSHFHSGGNTHDHSCRSALCFTPTPVLCTTQAFKPRKPTLGNGNNYRSGSYGFPSCHAANTFALATIVSLIARQRGLTIFMFLWALITCYSRVYLGVHYPGDLIFGGIIGWLCALLVYYVATGISSRLLMPAHTRPARRRFMRFKPAALIILAGITTIIVITAVSLWKA